MRSSSPPACNARSPPASPTAVKAASAPPGSRPAKSLEDFDFDHQRSLKRDTIAHLGTLDFVDRQRRTWCSSARPAPARPTCPSVSGSGPARPGTGSRSPPPPNGSPGSPTPTTPAGCRTSSSNSAAIPLLIDRRGRLHPVRSRSREPVLPTRLHPLRTSQPDRHQQQALRPLGRGLRRRRRRRRHDRPARPPRRSHLPQRRQLPTQRPRPRPRPHPPKPTDDQPGGSVFSRNQRVRVQPELTVLLPETEQVTRPGWGCLGPAANPARMTTHVICRSA